MKNKTLKIKPFSLLAYMIQFFISFAILSAVFQMIFGDYEAIEDFTEALAALLAIPLPLIFTIIKQSNAISELEQNIEANNSHIMLTEDQIHFLKKEKASDDLEKLSKRLYDYKTEYNNAVETYNIAINLFPFRLFKSLLGHKKKSYFSDFDF